jgi:hypothetical protein
VDSIRDFYSGRGYIDVVVEPEKVPNVEKGTLDLNYRIEEGEKAFVEKIEIKGNVRTKDKVIRRELDSRWWSCGSSGRSASMCRGRRRCARQIGGPRRGSRSGAVIDDDRNIRRGRASRVRAS